MNYQYELTQNYIINFRQLINGAFILLKNDGTTFITNNSLIEDYRYNNYCDYFAKYCTENQVQAWGYIFVGNDYCYLVCTNSVDFVSIRNMNQATVYVDGVELLNNGNLIGTTFGDEDAYQYYGGQYSNYFGVLPDTSMPYGAEYSGTLTHDEVTYFDYSMCWHPEDSYYYNYQVKQFTYNSSSYYFYPTYVQFSRKSNFGIGYGSVNSRTDLSYTYYNNGYNDGYKDGYENGISVDRNTANAFSYIEQAFSAVGGIMNLEIIPHVTLGLCFSIPLVIVIITTIFKLVKK